MVSGESAVVVESPYDAVVVHLYDVASEHNEGHMEAVWNVDSAGQVLVYLRECNGVRWGLALGSVVGVFSDAVVVS